MSKLVTFHPTYAFFHNPYEAGTFCVDLQHFAMMVQGKRLRPMVLDINPTAAKLRRLQRENEYLACDIETAPVGSNQGWTGKDPTQARLRVIGFGTSDEAIAVHWSNASTAVRRAVAEILADEDTIKVFHNGHWFDVRVLKRYNLPVSNIHDTRDLRRAHSSTSRLSLAYLASIYDYTNNWKHSEEEADAKGLAFTSDRTKLLKYNAQDCVETARVYDGLRKEPSDARVEKLYQVHTHLSIILAEMHTTGIHVLNHNREFMLWALAQNIEARAAKVKALVNIPHWEPTDAHLRSIIYKRHEKVKRIGGKKRGEDYEMARFSLPDPLNPKMYTDETQQTISVDEKSLLLLIASGECPPDLLPIIDAWWELGTVKKQMGYVKSEQVDHAIGPDGRLRPGWNSCGTETMRFTCSEPPMMVYAQELRAMFGPPKGKVWIHIDKSQLELRVMEAVSGDAMLKKALDTGDVYTFDARQWYGVKENEPVKKDARKSAKIIHLGSQYGAGIGTIYVQALMQDRKFRFNQARLLNSQFKQTYSGTVDYWHNELGRVNSCGYSEGRLLFGRRVYPAPPELSEAVNYPIQRTAAEMMNLELIELHTRLAQEVPSAKIVAQLHDAVDVECYEKDEERVKRIMMEVHQREWTIEGRTRVFPVEMKVARASEGRDWSDL